MPRVSDKQFWIDRQYFRVMYPYNIRQVKDGKKGTFRVLNRCYAPIGTTDPSKHDEAYTVDIDMCSALLEILKGWKYSREQSSSDDRTMYLYDDGCQPWVSKQNRKEYDARLEALQHFVTSGNI